MSHKQQSLRFPPPRATHGGHRAGAGRPPGSRTSTNISHARRPAVSKHRPHHVTVKVTRETWNLRSQRCYRPIRDALAAIHGRVGFRVAHYSVQHDHVHMLVEADDRARMSRGLRTLLARIARGLNGVMRARGRRFVDRYHEHVLRTPTETRNALRYVLGNRAHHLRQQGVETTAVDPFSSACLDMTLIHVASSWLLREGWTRAGPL